MNQFRKIIHIDMDAFYASIEQRDNDHYKNKPLVVGHKEKRGVVAAASYEARKYGVYSAMPSLTALKKCPNLIFVAPRFDHYREISHHIRTIFARHTEMIEPLSLDEAYLDVTHNHQKIALATTIAKAIKMDIHQELRLTASAGISYNKFLAKIASDYRKPDGLTIIHPKIAQNFVEKLPIEKFFGVGKITAKRMHELGITDGKSLKKRTKAELMHHFGKAGEHYYFYARAIDHRVVEPNQIRKSISVEETFSSDILNRHELHKILIILCEELILRTKKNQFIGRTLTLKVKYFDFTQITRSQTVNFALGDDTKVIGTLALALLESVSISRSIRLIGIGIHNNDQDKNDLNNELKQQSFPFQ